MFAPTRRIVAIVVLIAASLLAPAVTSVFATVPDGSLVATVGSGAQRARATVVTTVPESLSEAELLAAEVVRLTNLERVAAGRPTLDVHPAVSAAAVGHSGDQAAMGRMSHTGSDGSDAGRRLTREGFVWRTYGENVAVGQRTAQIVVDAWMGSPGHRANILGGSFTFIGVGVATSADGRRYWTMVLAA